MHSFHRATAFLKLTDKHKGPSGSLCRVKTEIPALTVLAASQLTMENSDSQPKMRGTKKKSLSKQIDFFYRASTIKTLSQKTSWPSQNPRENTVCLLLQGEVLQSSRFASHRSPPRPNPPAPLLPLPCPPGLLLVPLDPGWALFCR